MKRFYFSRMIILVTLLLGSNFGAFAQTFTYNYTGGVQTLTVPPGVTQVSVDAKGAIGGVAGPTSLLGTTTALGYGGRVQATLNVTPGQVLNIYVGGRGTDGTGAGVTGGFNGGGNAASHGGTYSGGGGGGATDIRLGSTALSARILVAGGGGGGGYNGAHYAGGAAGGLVGSPGLTNPSGTGGGGGNTTANTGGVGGGYPGYTYGSAGTAGQGGSSMAPNPGIGAGGGGGYWGGGGGGWSGGGGGSSYADPTYCTSVVHTAGYTGANGDGQVILVVLCTNPGTIVGAPICVGSTTTLTNSSGGGVWMSSNPSVATIGSATGIATGLTVGTTTITYLQSNPCGGASATYTLSVNPTPLPLPSSTLMCQYGTTTLTDTASVGTWSSGDPSLATVNSSGVVTGISPGTLTITRTLPGGCSTSTAVTVRSAPAVYTVTGGGAYCVGGSGVHIGVSNSATGVNYQLFNGSTSVASVSGTGSAIDFGLFTAAGTYTSLATTTSTGCTNNMTGTVSVSVNPLPAAITGTANACVGFSSTLSDATPGGTWTSAAPAVASVGLGTGVVTGITAGTTTITYTLTGTGCRTTIPYLVNPQPSAIGGPSNVCVGSNVTLTNTLPGGTWSSGSTGIASIVPGTGFAAGVTPGSAVITYTLLTGCNTSTSLVVNPIPTPYAVTGGGSYCAGGSGAHVGLAYSSSGVNYQLYAGTSPVGAPVPGSNSGLDFGLQIAPGTYSVVGNNPLTGCSGNMSGTTLITINPLPNIYNVIGGGGYCIGGTGVNVRLDLSDVGIKYQLYNGLTPVGGLVTGTGGPINFGLFTTAGTYTVVATNPVTGCTSIMNNSALIVVNPLPTAYTVGGGGHYCAGGAGVHVTLSGSDAGTTYILYRGTTRVDSTFSIGGPLDFAGITTPGTYTIVGRDGSLCSGNMLGSVTVVIDPLPVVYTVTGGGGYCAGDAGVHIGLSFSSTGINYQLWYSGGLVTTVSGSGSGLDFGVHSNPGVYMVIAVNATSGCTNNMGGSATISVNPVPNMYAVTGGGNYCLTTTGVHVGTDLSDFGTNYQLYRGGVATGAPMGGSGGPLDFGLFTTPGTYTVKATNPVTGCATWLSGSALVGVDPLPNIYNVTGGGSYCADGFGVAVGLSGSQTGVSYSLWLGGAPTGTVLLGTGGSLNFGLQIAPGVYTVVANNTVTGCTRNMTGTATVMINAVPNVFLITGGGNYCTGGTGVSIGLDGSTSGISYQLYNSMGTSGSAVAGTSTAINFGLRTTPGVYYVVARNPLTGCTTIMAGTANVIADPLPADYAVIGGGPYCVGGSGMSVGTAGSDIGIDYQLYLGTTPVGAPQGGSGMGLDFGLQTAAGVYTVRATDLVTGCTKVMPGSALITIISNTVHLVTGGGGYCAGGTGVHVGLGGSSLGVNYQLMIGGTPSGAPVSGTGLPMDFGLQTTADIYTVVATDSTYGCVGAMGGSVTVVENPLPVANNVTGGGAFCAGGAGASIGLDNGDAGIGYQLYNGTATVGSPVSGSGTALDFGIFTVPGTYTVIGTNTATGCSGNMAGSATITVKPVPTAYRDSVTGPNPMYPGYYCAADSGVFIYVGGSDTGVNYQLWRGTTMIGSPVAGTGMPLSMGLYSVAGTYTITASDPSTGCNNNMMGTATIHIIPLPIVHNVTGGGSFCPGGAGQSIGLDGSEAGFFYQLYGTGRLSPVTRYGTGSPIDFGVQDTLGTYTVLANNVITTCLNNMFGSATIKHDTILTPTVNIRAYPGTDVHVWHVDSIRVTVANAGPNPTYQWIINGHVIAGATNASFSDHEFFNNDSVACQVTASGPCGGYTTTKWVHIKLFNVGVNNVNAGASDIRLVPNPNKGVFSLKGATGSITTEDVTMEVTNMLGQVVYRGTATARDGNVDAQVQLNGNLANGMYILNLRSSAGNTVFHFVVEQ